MVIGLIVSFLLLVMIASIVVPTGNLGAFERKRRQENRGDLEVERELHHSDIVSLQRVLEAVLLVTTTALSVASFGWIIGVIVAVLIAAQYGSLARVSFLRSRTLSLYLKVEPRILQTVESYPSLAKYIRVFTPESPDIVLHSRQELTHLIETSAGILTSDEKKLLLANLSFSSREVREVMTPRSMIDSINNVEILGPLVLDDLHKKGHSRFPVIENDVDHVVGVLHLRDAVMVRADKSHTSKAEAAMEKRVFYIHENQSLEHALTAFIKTHHHLFIVVNEYRETVGLLTLEDVMEAMIGREIIDEFDEHDDLRKVASRNPRGNNTAREAKDV